MDLTRISCILDSNVMVSNLCDNGDLGVASFRLVQQIRSLLKLKWNVKVCHTYREVNSCI